jgi:hypothetical protein
MQFSLARISAALTFLLAKKLICLSLVRSGRGVPRLYSAHQRDFVNAAGLDQFLPLPTTANASLQSISGRVIKRDA